MDLNRAKRIAVIGGMNMDIGGRAGGALQLREEMATHSCILA